MISRPGVATHVRAWTIACVAAIVSLGGPMTVGAQSASVVAEFKSLLDVRYSAIARADTTTTGRYLANDMSWFGTAGAGLAKTQFLAIVSQRQIPAPTYEVDSVRVRLSGDIALVEYRRSDHRKVNSFEEITRVNAQEVFARRKGKWLLERHTQSWVVTPVTPIELDSATLSAFVGRYRIAPGYVDNVHLERNELVATATGQSIGARLVPVSATAFSPDGVGALIVFERDSTGRVIGYVQGYPDGTVFRAGRLP